MDFRATFGGIAVGDECVLMFTIVIGTLSLWD